jgi:hypothetical protein
MAVGFFYGTLQAIGGGLVSGAIGQKNGDVTPGTDIIIAGDSMAACRNVCVFGYRGD